MKDNIRKIIDSRIYRWFVVVYIVAVAVVIIFSADIFSPYHSFTNDISDSMYPSINRGSVTILKEYPKYEIGDVISYYSNFGGTDEIVTHRIVDIGGNVYTTKGDNNTVADRELVRPRLVIGKVVYTIPDLGYLITFAKSQIGTWVCIIIPALFIIAAESFRTIMILKHEDLVKKKEDEQEDGIIPA
jgi:signal peptidase I